MPKYRSCSVDSHPVPPSPVNDSNIVMQNLIFTSKKLYLDVLWKPPASPNGYITKSELRIAREYLLPTSEDGPTDYSYKFTIKVTQHIFPRNVMINPYQGNLTETVINTSAIYQIKELFCLYLQVVKN